MRRWGGVLEEREERCVCVIEYGMIRLTLLLFRCSFPVIYNIAMSILMNDNLYFFYQRRLETERPRNGQNSFTTIEIDTKSRPSKQ